jgi:glycosyltransferase involved in cell wall biosynthesis
MTERLRVGIELVWLGAHAGGIGRYAEELIAALALRDDVELHVFTGRDLPSEHSSRPWVDRATWTTLPVRPTGSLMQLAATFAAVPLLAAGRRLDVLHGPANVVARVAPGVRRVVTMHDAIWRHAGTDWGPQDAIRAMERVSVPTVRAADRVIAVSRAAAEDLISELGLARDRVDVVPHGVQAPRAGAGRTPESELRRRLALGDGPVALCVAQKRPYKRHDVVIRAFAAARDRSTRLVLPGAPTSFENDLRDLAATLGVSERVRFVDWVSEADLEGLYAMSRCVVLASDLEGFGMPVLEAMARGVPVACSAAGALGEVAGGAALTFDPADQDTADAAVDRLLSDGGLRAELVVRGRERAAAFTWERAAEQTVEAYRRALDR